MNQAEQPSYNCKETQTQVQPEVVQMEKLQEKIDYTRVSGAGVKPRILPVISLQPPSTLQDEIAAGQQSRRDYYALQQALDADVLYLNDAQATLLGRLITRLLGKRPALVWAAFCRRNAYDILYAETEMIGLPLAMLLKLSRTHPGRPRHVTLAHYLSPLKKRIFFRLGAGSHIDTLIVHCAAQHTLAIETLQHSL